MVIASGKFSAIDYALHFGGHCRDCADRDGTCDNGVPCDPAITRAVAEHILNAWAYGIKHGYMDDPFPALVPSPALEANQQVVETLKAEHRAQMADMSERFREVNVTEALRQMGNDKQVIETLRAAVEAAYHEGWSDRISYRATDPEASADDGWTFSEARAAIAPTQPEPTRGQSDAEL